MAAESGWRRIRCHCSLLVNDPRQWFDHQPFSFVILIGDSGKKINDFSLFKSFF